VLLQAHAAADAAGVQLRLAGVQPAVQHRLERTGTIKAAAAISQPGRGAGRRPRYPGLIRPPRQ
jgi:hypothetical protein